MMAERKTPYVGVNMTVEARDELRDLVLQVPQFVAGRRITISDTIRALVRLGARDPAEVARILAGLPRADRKGR